LEVRGGERVVDDQESAVCMGELGRAAMSAICNMGFEGDSTHTIRVVGRNAAATSAGSSSETGSNARPERRVHLGENAVGSAIDVVPDEDVVARVQKPEHRVNG